MGIAKSGKIRTDLAMAIIETFAQAGIAIPSGQAEIGIRRMDWLREMIAEGASLPPARAPATASGHRQKLRRCMFRCRPNKDTRRQLG